MPRRMIDPKIWFNEKVASLPDAGRLLFIGIFSNADDDGRLKASPKFLKATIFPYDEDKTVEHVKELRDKCSALELIRVYSKNSREYLDIPGWGEHQKIRKDRYTPSELPSFDDRDNQMATSEQPYGNQPTTTGDPSIGEGRGGKSSVVKSNRIPLVSVAPSDGSTQKTKTRVKPHQQEAGRFLDMVEKHEGISLPSRRDKLINQVRRLLSIRGATPEKIFECYCWLKRNQVFFRNKAPPQVIGGMLDRYTYWEQGKLKPDIRRPEPRTKPTDFKGKW